MTSVHPSAAAGFHRGAADYERGRPGYPPAAIDLLAERLGLGQGSRIVDLAAGTGKLTRALTGLGAELVAVEPVSGMREQLRRAVPGVEVCDGTAEQLPFADASRDAVLVAQAFHWFDVETAAAEIARVLVSGGGLGIVRNVRDPSPPWVGEMQALIDEHRSHGRSQATSRWRERLEQTGRFSPLREDIVSHVVSSDRDALLAHVTSISFIATLAASERAGLLAAVSAILDRHAVGVDGAPVAMPYETRVVWSRRV